MHAASELSLFFPAPKRDLRARQQYSCVRLLTNMYRLQIYDSGRLRSRAIGRDSNDLKLKHLNISFIQLVEPSQYF